MCGVESSVSVTGVVRMKEGDVACVCVCVCAVCEYVCWSHVSEGECV